MLITIENVLSSQELATARALLDQSHWSNGQISAGLQAAQVKNNQQLAAQAEHLPQLRQLVQAALQRNPIFFTAALPLKLLAPEFNRYSAQTNSYGLHTDCAMRQVPDQMGAYLRSDLSATLFLSEPNEYDGGVLTINDTFGQHGIKLGAGSLVLYPSSSLHAVSPVTCGERLACFMFIQSMVRDPAQRRLLYEMDMALLQLREQFNADELMLLTITGDYASRLRSYELLAREFELQ